MTMLNKTQLEERIEILLRQAKATTEEEKDSLMTQLKLLNLQYKDMTGHGYGIIIPEAVGSCDYETLRRTKK